MHLYEFKTKQNKTKCRPGQSRLPRNSVSKNEKQKNNKRKRHKWLAGSGGAEFETSLVYRIKLVLRQPRTQKNSVSERD